jgi:competence protein ComEA
MATPTDDAAVRARLAGIALPPPAPGWVPEPPDGVAAPPPPPRPPPPPLAAATPSPADRLPHWLRAGAFAPSPEALLWLAAAGAVVLLLMAYVLLHHRPAPVASAPPPVSDVTAPLPSPSPVGIVVDVGGRVRKPGLVTLPQGARVADAIAAAGGALHQHDLVAVNLAARVSDGELLLVGVPGGVAGGAGGSGGAGPIDLNSASVDQLDALPGVGPVLAQRIVDYRQQHGSFASIDDLNNVPGIGPAKFAELKPLVAV